MTKILLPLIALAFSFAFSACSTTRANHSGSCCSASVKKSCDDGSKTCSADKKSKKKSGCCS